MLFNDIKIGDRLEIGLARYKNNEGVTFISLVEEISGPYQLLVQMPMSYGKLIKLPQNQDYSVTFFTERGMLNFRATIEAFLKQDEFHMMKIKLTTQGEQMQRRNYFRLPCVLPVKFSELEPEILSLIDTPESNVQTMSEGVAKDLGGGGIRFVSNDNVEARKIQCFLELFNQEVMIICKVLQKQHFPKSHYAYQYRAEFVGILPHEREIIIQYIFSEQNKLIQKLRK